MIFTDGNNLHQAFIPGYGIKDRDFLDQFDALGRLESNLDLVPLSEMPFHYRDTYNEVDAPQNTLYTYDWNKWAMIDTHANIKMPRAYHWTKQDEKQYFLSQFGIYELDTDKWEINNMFAMGRPEFGYDSAFSKIGNHLLLVGGYRLLTILILELLIVSHKKDTMLLI